MLQVRSPAERAGLCHGNMPVDGKPDFAGQPRSTPLHSLSLGEKVISDSHLAA